MVKLELTDETYSELTDFRTKVQSYLRRYGVDVNDDFAINEAILLAGLNYDDDEARKKYLEEFEASMGEDFMKLKAKDRKKIARSIRRTLWKNLK